MPATATPPNAAPADAGDALIEQYELADENDPVETVSAPKAAAQTPPVKLSDPTPGQIDQSEAPVAIKHPAWVVKQAKQLGVTQQEIDSTPTDELKDQLLFASNQRERIQHDNPGRPRDEHGRFVAAPPEPSAPAQEPEFSLKSIGVDLDEADEFTQNTLTKVLAPLVKQISALQAELAGVKQAEQERQVGQFYDSLDQMFNENETVFGKGSRKKMDPTSDEFFRRKMTIEAMRQIKAEDPHGSREDHFALACKRLFLTAPTSAPTPPVETPKPVAPAVKPAKDPHGFANGKLTQPTGRVAAPAPKGDGAALDHIRDWRKNFIPDAGGDATSDDEETLE